VHGKQSREFAYGDVISFQQSGAGGYGDPLERDPARVLADVLDEYTSIEAAREDYGVVVTGESVGLRVDADATATMRAERRRLPAARARPSRGAPAAGPPRP
jgi:N-methylhydantoinase B/oxoprolinase/acetone carboxylase alpha subunit